MPVPADAGPFLAGGGLTALAGAVYALARAVAPACRAVVEYTARQDVQFTRMVKTLDKMNDRLENVERALVARETVPLSPPRIEAVR